MPNHLRRLIAPRRGQVIAAVRFDLNCCGRSVVIEQVQKFQLNNYVAGGFDDLVISCGNNRTLVDLDSHLVATNGIQS